MNYDKNHTTSTKLLQTDLWVAQKAEVIVTVARDVSVTAAYCWYNDDKTFLALELLHWANCHIRPPFLFQRTTHLLNLNHTTYCLSRYTAAHRRISQTRASQRLRPVAGSARLAPSHASYHGPELVWATGRLMSPDRGFGTSCLLHCGHLTVSANSEDSWKRFRLSRTRLQRLVTLAFRRLIQILLLTYFTQTDETSTIFWHHTLVEGCIGCCFFSVWLKLSRRRCHRSAGNFARWYISIPDRSSPLWGCTPGPPNPKFLA